MNTDESERSVKRFSNNWRSSSEKGRKDKYIQRETNTSVKVKNTGDDTKKSTSTKNSPSGTITSTGMQTRHRWKSIHSAAHSTEILPDIEQRASQIPSLEVKLEDLAVTTASAAKPVRSMSSSDATRPPKPPTAVSRYSSPNIQCSPRPDTNDNMQENPSNNQPTKDSASTWKESSYWYRNSSPAGARYDMFLASDAQKLFKSTPNIVKIDDNIYVGNLETAYDEWLTGRLHIQSIVDVSNIDPDSVPTSRKNAVPRPRDNSYRPPAVLRTSVPMLNYSFSWTNLKETFREINVFLEGAIRNNKGALVVCNTGTTYSVVVVMQFLINVKHFSFEYALALIKRRNKDSELTDNMLEVLQIVEREMLDAKSETSGVYSADGSSLSGITLSDRPMSSLSDPQDSTPRTPTDIHLKGPKYAWNDDESEV